MKTGEGSTVSAVDDIRFAPRADGTGTRIEYRYEAAISGKVASVEITSDGPLAQLAHQLRLRDVGAEGDGDRVVDLLVEARLAGLEPVQREVEVEVTPAGRLFVRSVCMHFDRYLAAHEGRRVFSQTI